MLDLTALLSQMLNVQFAGISGIPHLAMTVAGALLVSREMGRAKVAMLPIGVTLGLGVGIPANPVTYIVLLGLYVTEVFSLQLMARPIKEAVSMGSALISEEAKARAKPRISKSMSFIGPTETETNAEIQREKADASIIGDSIFSGEWHARRTHPRFQDALEGKAKTRTIKNRPSTPMLKQ